MRAIRWMRSALLALGLFGGLGWLAQAQAVAVVPTQSTFEWSGICSDCTAIGNSASHVVTGTLVLQDYTLGQLIDETNFVSFSYRGSNLVSPYTVTIGDLPVGLDLQYWLAGSIPVAQGAGTFEIGWSDGLHFQTQADGTWSTCAPGINSGTGEPSFYGGGSCNFSFFVHNDAGTGGAFSAAAVPEPAEWALLLAGLGVIGLARRRRSLPARA